MKITWNKWAESQPEIGEMILVTGKNFYSGELQPLSPNTILQLEGRPEYIVKEDGSYVYTGKIVDVKLVHSENISIPFRGEFEVEYWMYLKDLMPKI